MNSVCREEPEKLLPLTQVDKPESLALDGFFGAWD